MTDKEYLGTYLTIPGAASTPDAEWARNIIFTIPGKSAGSPSVSISATEGAHGVIIFTVNVIGTSKSTADLQGLFFNLNNDSKLAGLIFSGNRVMNFDTVDVINLGNGANMQGVASPFDAGVRFGTPGIKNGNISTTIFTLSNLAQNLTLDDIANVQFGAQTSTNEKLVFTAPAAPDARADTYQIFEDGQAGLDSSSHIPVDTLFEVLTNDTDADGNKLTITEVRGALHGHVEIVDGADADLLAGDALLYTPDADYSGADHFEYRITDGHGGTDFATTDVAIAAVADIPTLDYEIIATGDVNQMIVRVTTHQTDADSSEFIDRIELSGIPDDVTVDQSAYNPTDKPGLIVHDFLLTLPKGKDTDFTLGIKAVAVEPSNGDEAFASQPVDISFAYHKNSFESKFVAKTQSMWGSGNADDDHLTYDRSDFIGLDNSITNVDLGVDLGIASANLHIDHLDYKFGLQSTLHIGTGEVDAKASYAVDVETFYNKTTDFLHFETDATVDLAHSSFSTLSPQVTYMLDLIAEVDALMTYRAEVNIPGIPAWWIFPEIPGYNPDPWTGEVPSFSFNESPNILDFDGNTLTLFGASYEYDDGTIAGSAGLAVDATKTIELGDNMEVEFKIPTIETESEIVGNHLESEGDDDFITLTADMDGLLWGMLHPKAEPLPGQPPLPPDPTEGLSPFAYTKEFEFGGDAGVKLVINLDWLNYEMAASIGFGQEFSMSFGDLDGTLIFEDGTTMGGYILGQDYDLFNASTHDSNGDGTIEFGLELKPDATFSSNLALISKLTHTLELFKAAITLEIPIFEDPEFSIGPWMEFGGVIADLPLVSVIPTSSFSFDLGHTTEYFVV